MIVMRILAFTIGAVIVVIVGSAIVNRVPFLQGIR